MVRYVFGKCSKEAAHTQNIENSVANKVMYGLVIPLALYISLTNAAKFDKEPVKLESCDPVSRVCEMTPAMTKEEFSAHNNMVALKAFGWFGIAMLGVTGLGRSIREVQAEQDKLGGAIETFNDIVRAQEQHDESSETLEMTDGTDVSPVSEGAVQESQTPVVRPAKAPQKTL